MKIKYNLIKKVSLKEFAEENDLTLEITEREGMPLGDPNLFSASFRELHPATMVDIVNGNGETPEAAVHDLVRRISRKILSWNTPNSIGTRMVPQLTFAGHLPERGDK